MEQSRVVRLCLLLAALFALSCTRQQKSATVTLKVPQFTQSQKLTYAKVDAATIRRLSDNGSNFNSLLNPTSTTDLNCFVVFVGGDGFDQGGTCTVSNGSTFKVGAYAGGVLSGGTAIIPDVTSGTRSLILVGFHASSTSVCTDFHVGMNQAQLSEPFIVAQTKVNVQASSTPINVDMTASLTTSKISDCKFANDIGGNTGYFGNGSDGDIDTAALSGTQSLSSMTSGGHYLMSVSDVTAIAQNPDGTAKITVGQPWNSSTKTHVNDGDEVMLYVVGASGGSPGGCGGMSTNDDTDGVYAGFSYSGVVNGTTTGANGNSFNLTLNDLRWFNIPSGNLGISGSSTVSTPPAFCHVLAVRVPQINSITANADLELWQSSNGLFDFGNSGVQTTAGLLPIRVKAGIYVGAGATLSFRADGAGYQGGSSGFRGQSPLGRNDLFGETISNGQGGGIDSSTGCGGGHGGIGGCDNPSAAGTVEGDPYGCGSGVADPSMSCLLGKFFFGGGGGSASGSAGNGGGALRIYANQITLADSGSHLIFSAKGNDATGTLDGGGAGGSILVSTNSIIGPTASTWDLSATGGVGGNGTGGNGGGGGRIHVITQNASDWSGNLNEYVGGGSGHVSGTAGTCYGSGLSPNCLAP